MAESPAAYTVGMILQNTEGNLAPIQCVGKNMVPCAQMDKCVSARLWRMVDEAVSSVIDHVTLQDLVDWQEEQEVK